jgi:ketosteroid isomerase-like protein
MPVDRVNLVREGFEAWNADDPQWVLNHMSPEVEWIAPERDPFPGTYKGYEGVQEFWTRWRNAVGQLKFTPDEVIDAGKHVVVIANRWARNEMTGLQISVQVFTFNDETSASASRSSMTAARRSGRRASNDACPARSARVAKIRSR